MHKVMPGRRRDAIRDLYISVQDHSKKTTRAKCKYCGDTILGQVDRMKHHSMVSTIFYFHFLMLISLFVMQ